MMIKADFLLLGRFQKERRKAPLYHLLFLLFFLLANNVWAQEREVKGRVTSEEGNPLVGVSIHVKGTTASTSSAEGGQFSLTTNPGSVLVFSYVGFATQEYTLSDETDLQITMSSSESQLDEVVVVGYGTQRKEAVTGSVASVSGEKMNEVPAANITQALQGRVAGVQMTQTSSKAGASMQIRIRGTRSLNASNDPLVVLDGIPFAGSIGDINPIDIKSVDILKDASATAIYGSRGANGVILVTTHKGYTGQDARVSFNSYTGLKTLFARYPMMNGAEFVELRKAAGLYQNGVDESDNVDVDWQDLLYKNGIMTSQDLSVSGGKEQTIFDFSLG